MLYTINKVYKFIKYSLMALDGGNFNDRISSLDTYLDTVEEAIDNWSYQSGL